MNETIKRWSETSYMHTVKKLPELHNHFPYSNRLYPDRSIRPFRHPHHGLSVFR